MRILVTGAKGFIGRHLVLALRDFYHTVYEYDIDCGDLNEFTKDCELVFHLAGVNRPTDGDFSGNVTALTDLLDALKSNHNKCPIVMSSSILAETDTPYGKSKLEAENILNDYGVTNEVETYVYRICNVFGPGGRKDYNSVVATWCHNLSHNAKCQIDDPGREVTFVYIDDLIKSFTTFVNKGEMVAPNVTRTSLQDLYNALLQIKGSVERGDMWENTSRFMNQLYSTYLYHMGYPILYKEMHEDDRGSFTELFRSKHCGQISVNVIKPGVTKGDHYHNSKWEQFIVLKGRCVIKETNLFTGQEKRYSADEYEFNRSFYMKPMHTHSITNVGTIDAVVLIYCNECYDEVNDDTHKA